MEDPIAIYFGHAAGKPEWGLWGKARPKEPEAIPAHALLCHMADVTCVAEQLLDGVLPSSTRRRLLEPLGVPEEAARKWLLLVVGLHDLGKATPAFQVKWEAAIAPLRAAGYDLSPPRNARDHGTCGVDLVQSALAGLGVESGFARRLARASAAHHGSFPTDDAATPPFGSAVGGELGRERLWETARQAIVQQLVGCFGDPGLPIPSPVDKRDWAFFSALAGFVSVADWIGSMAEVFTYEMPSCDITSYAARSRERAAEALVRVGFARAARPAARSFRELFDVAPWPLHTSIEALTARLDPPFCLIVEAPMGEGKTEAALFVAHDLAARGVHDGVYVGLPTQATANQMFDRLYAFLSRTRPDQRTNLQLLHGDAVFDTRVRDLLRAVYSPDGAVVCEGWFLKKKRALLAPFGAGTIDQALLSVLRTKHAFVRQLGLAAKTVVLDEVHAYDTYTSTLLDRLVAWLGALGTSVVLLSATLPSERRKALLEAYAGRGLSLEDTPYPRISAVNRSGTETVALAARRPSLPVSIHWVSEEPASALERLRGQLADGGCVGWICNTVRRAQAAYRLARDAQRAGTLPSDTELLLLHARFPQDPRRALEQRLIAKLGRTGVRPDRMLVIGTQVLEQSLDIDFDLLVTDVAPIDLVIQRAGRLHRHERPRPRGAERAQLVVAAPEGDPGEVPLKTNAAVYVAFLVRRSLAALRLEATLRIPDDIERLVEGVYSAPDPTALRGALAREYDDYTREREGDAQTARQRIWPTPRVEDDPFADLVMPFDEDDAEMAKALRAETRLGDESLELVCLFGTAEQAFLDRSRTRSVDLRAEPTPDLVRLIAGRTVRVSRPDLVRTLAQQRPPAAWADVAPLSRRRPLFFGNAPLLMDRVTVQLDDELGLTIDSHKGGLGYRAKPSRTNA